MKHLFTLLFIATTAVNYAQDSVKLQLNMSKNDTYKNTMLMEQVVDGTPAMKMNLNMTMKVTGKTDKNITAVSTIESIKMNMTQGGMTMGYDSDKKESELTPMEKMMKPQMDPMLTAEITTVYGKKGDIEKVEVTPQLPGMDQFGKGAGISFPEKAISIGSSWDVEDFQQGTTTNSKYTVNKIENGIVYLDIVGTITGAGEGTLDGTAQVNIASGMTEVSEINMVFTIEVPGADGTMQKSKNEMVMKNTSVKQ